jgi:hypothetical protein
MKNIHGNVKCDCGHKQKDHYAKEGWCHSLTHINSGKCGCTWFHPNVKYIRRKKIEKAKKRQLKLF